LLLAGLAVPIVYVVWLAVVFRLLLLLAVVVICCTLTVGCCFSYLFSILLAVGCFRVGCWLLAVAFITIYSLAVADVGCFWLLAGC
jgi:hypothetical protein